MHEKMWIDMLDSCALAYNMSVHNSMKYTPFELVFSKQAALPINVDIMRQPRRVSVRLAVCRQAKESIVTAQNKQTENLLIKGMHSQMLMPWENLLLKILSSESV